MQAAERVLFRAAAVEQLEIWTKRAEVGFVRAQPNSDPAAVVFDAIQAAKARQRVNLLPWKKPASPPLNHLAI